VRGEGVCHQAPHAGEPANAAERGRNPRDLQGRVVKCLVAPAFRPVPQIRVLQFGMQSGAEDTGRNAGATNTGRGLLVIALAAGGGVRPAGFAPTLYVPCDFVAFWSSSVLSADGHTPYDPVCLLPLQDAAGFRLGYAITMFNPPWVLPLLAPLAALPVKAAFAVWLGVQLALVLVAAGWLGQALGGSARRAWGAAVLAAGGGPPVPLLPRRRRPPPSGAL